MYHQNPNPCLLQTLAVTSSALLQVQRTYILCANSTFTIGLLTTGSLQPVGGEFPLTVMNPNMHVLCQAPGTCVFEGNPPAIFSLVNSTLLAAFLKSQNSPPLPAGYRVDASNLLVDGLVFRRMTDENKESSQSIVSLPGFGHNMTIKNCLWKQANATSPPFSAIALHRIEDYGVSNQGRGSLYSSLLLDNCTIRDNVFGFSVMYAQVDFKNFTLPSHKVTIVNSEFERNKILSNYQRDSKIVQVEAAAVFYLRDSTTEFTNVLIKNNTIKRTLAAIVLTNSYFSYSNLRFQHNVILERFGLNCTDVARITRFRNASSSTGFSFIESGCIEFDSNGVALKPPTRMPTAKPPPTIKPTRSPSTTRPTRRPTKLSPNLFSPVE